MVSALHLFRKASMLSCLAVAPIFMILAIAFSIHMVIFLRRSISTQGTIINLASVRDANGNSLTFAPIFSFTSEGGTYTVTSDTSSNPPRFSIGQRVEIRYEKSHPTAARIATFGQLWLFPIAFGVTGILTTFAGLLLMRFGRQIVQPALQ